MSKHLVRVASVASLVTLGAGIAWASNPLFSASLSDGVLNIMTHELPRGWYTTRGAFDRSKTPLRTDWSIGGTACSEGGASGRISSGALGMFHEVLNSAGQVNGYTYDLLLDLSAHQNRWHNYIDCDGNAQVVGCSLASPVTVTVSAWAGTTGTCRVGEDGSCVEGTEHLLLSAVQGPDQVETECGDSCGIGDCRSECADTCNSISNKDDRQTCMKECRCQCMLQRPAGCHVPDECLD